MIDENDVTGGRSIWMRSGDNQTAPQGDKRYRVNPSRKFYVAQLLGTVMNVSESAERVTESRANERYVIFEGKRYQLRRAEDLPRSLRQAIGRGISMYIGGLTVTSVNVAMVAPHPFIYIATKAAREFYAEKMGDKGPVPLPGTVAKTPKGRRTGSTGS